MLQPAARNCLNSTYRCAKTFICWIAEAFATSACWYSFLLVDHFAMSVSFRGCPFPNLFGLRNREFNTADSQSALTRTKCFGKPRTGYNPFPNIHTKNYIFFAYQYGANILSFNIVPIAPGAFEKISVFSFFKQNLGKQAIKLIAYSESNDFHFMSLRSYFANSSSESSPALYISCAHCREPSLIFSPAWGLRLRLNIKCDITTITKAETQITHDC